MKQAHLIFGDQLFKDHPAVGSDDPVIMIEADSIFRRCKYHKHKIMLLLIAMREYKQYLESNGNTVIYVELSDGSSFTKELQNVLQEESIEELKVMRPNSRGALEMLKGLDVSVKITPNMHFMTNPDSFSEWFEARKQPKMEDFYRMRRKQTGVLMDNDKPVGGEWNYDGDNRKPLPKKGIDIPERDLGCEGKSANDVSDLVNKLYKTNPGSTDNFWLTPTHEGAENSLNFFINECLSKFGDYEDAMKQGEQFLLHSVLSPYINLGLLTPQQCIEAAVKAYESGAAPLNSVEGYVRQILGWREYMNGLYWNKDDFMDSNFFEFDKELEDWWYTEKYKDQDLPAPVLHALDTVHGYGYNHHIERLMVLGNWFLLNQYSPASVYEWFSAMYVDAYEWVMQPNVLGMSQYADGGFVATKPYISGGNYLQKMGRFWDSTQDARDSVFTDLYWEFLYTNKDKLKNNHRMALVLSQAEKNHKK